MTSSGRWPELPTGEWIDTIETFHLFTQVVGKVRLVQAPWMNHSWSVPLYVTSRGLGTSLVPHGSDGFELDLDLVDHQLLLSTTSGVRLATDLTGTSVSAFHARVMTMLADAGMPVEINPMPNEIADAVPFPDDHDHATYVPEHAEALLGALLQSTRVFQRFRAGFRGKASPVHFFWGSFDLAVTRFSGRPAPPHPGGVPNFADDVAREAYSHEVTSAGLWFGNAESPTPIFYSYAYPTPDGFAEARVAPDEAAWFEPLGEFVLPYDAVRVAPDPDATLLAFFESTHAAAADLAGWDRVALECETPHGPDWWRNRPHD
ncbi:MAG: DUF5996 family protein [Actinomycetota bacterium]